MKRINKDTITLIRVKQVCPHPVDPVTTFKWVFVNQPIALLISTQPSHNKRAESNMLADKKGPQHLIQLVVWVIHLFLIDLFLPGLDLHLTLISYFFKAIIDYFFNCVYFYIIKVFHRKKKYLFYFRV